MERASNRASDCLVCFSSSSPPPPQSRRSRPFHIHRISLHILYRHLFVVSCVCVCVCASG